MTAIAYTAPHARLSIRMLLIVLLRAVLLPLVTWATASVISGPIARQVGANDVGSLMMEENVGASAGPADRAPIGEMER